MPENDDITYLTKGLLPGPESSEPSFQPQLENGVDPSTYTQTDLPEDLINKIPNSSTYSTDLPFQQPTKQETSPDVLSADDVSALIDDMQIFHNAKVQNPYLKGQEKLFGAGVKDLAYERYYSHPEFKKLGFSPFRDNETLYNKNSSWWDEMSRATLQWTKLVGLAFEDSLGFGKISDTNLAKEQEKSMIIGQSSKGGLTGFTTNLFLNSGYTVGIMAELVAEEALLAGVTAATGGLSSEATVGLMASRGVRAANNISKGFKMMGKAVKQLDKLQDLYKSRKFWAGVKQVGGGAANVLNPLSETTDFIKNYQKFGKVGALAKTAKGFASFYSDVRNLRLAFGEAALEAGGVENQLGEELLNDFYKVHKRTPTDEEAAKMRNTAKAAALSTAYWNMGTIFFSNKIVFDNLFKGFSPVRKFTDDVIMKNAAGKIILNKSGKKGFEVINKGLKGFWKTAKNPKNYISGGVGYFKANFTEGLQEIAQEMISSSAMDYYRNQYKGNSLEGGYWAVIGDNLQKQISPEGFETFMSGFLMGGLVQGPQRTVSSLFNSVRGRIKHGSEGYAAIKVQREQELNEMANRLNDMYKKPEKFFAPDLENLANQTRYEEGMNKASEEGDQKAFMDLKDASVYSHIYTALRQDRMDVFIENLENLKNLSDEEIKKDYKMDKNSFVTGIDKAIKRAKGIENRYNLVQRKYNNPFNPNAFKKDSEEYNQEMIKHLAYQNAQRDLIFMQYSFDRNLERMKSVYEKTKNDAKLSKVSQDEFNVLFTLGNTIQEVDRIKKEIEAIGEPIDKTLKEHVKERKKRVELLKAYKEALFEYHSLPQNRTESADSTKKDKEHENKVVDELYKTYKEYIKHLAKHNKDYAFDEHIQESFQSFLDYLDLEVETETLNSSINTLTNPEKFMERASRIAEMQKNIHDNRKKIIRKALDEYVKLKDSNELLQALYEEGVFFDSKELGELIENKKVPTTFYDTLSQEDIQIGSDKWNKAIAILEGYLGELMNIPISKTEVGGLDSKARNKFKKDKRTYKDLAKQYGFDPKEASSKIPLTEVLQTIIDSKYATVREKALAKRLITLAKENEFVTFVNNLNKPGEYDKENQTLIDPRYSSHNYRFGDKHPIEYIILHQEIHRRTIEGLKNDQTFKSEVEKLLTLAKEHVSQSKNKQEYALLNGLNNEADFVAEAMSSENFQKFLSQIPYNADGTSTWDEFVNSVIKFLKRLFGERVDNSVLNGAISVITNKIDIDFNKVKSETNSKAEQSSNEKPETEKLTQNTSFDVLDSAEHSILMHRLIQAFKDRNAKLEREGAEPMLSGWELLSSDDIKKNPIFKNAFIKHNSAARKLINEYNKETGRTKEPAKNKQSQKQKRDTENILVEPINDEEYARFVDQDEVSSERLDKIAHKIKNNTPISPRELGIFRSKTAEINEKLRQIQNQEKIPTQWNRQMREDILALGYTEREIRTMPVAEGYRIIQEGLTKEQREQTVQAENERQKLQVLEKLQKAQENITNIIKQATNMQELDAAEIAILEMPNIFQIGITAQMIQDLVAAKKTGIEAIEEYIGLTAENTIVDELRELNNPKLINERAEEESKTKEEEGEVTEDLRPSTRTIPFQSLSKKIGDYFRAVAPTALADRIQEALAWKDVKDPNYNVPDPQQAFYFKVKRNLLQDLVDADYDSSKMNYKGHGPVYLTAMSISQVEDADIRPDDDIETYDPYKKGVVLMLTDQYGVPLMFDDKGMPTLEEGKPAYYKLRATDKIFRPDGSVNLRPEDNKAISAIARQKKISKKAAEKIYLKELSLIKDIREFVQKDPERNTVKSVINGGSLGWIPVSYEYRRRLSNVNFEGQVLNFRTTTSDGQIPGMRQGITYFELNDMYGQPIVVERPHIGKDTDLTDTIVSLLVDDLVDHAGNPIDFNTRRLRVEDFIYKNDTRIQLGVEPNNPNMRFIMIHGDKYNLSSEEGKAKARKRLNEYFNELTPMTPIKKSNIKSSQRILPQNAPKSKYKTNDVLEINQGDGTKKYMVIDKAKLHINRSRLNGNFEMPTITKADDGTVTMTTEIKSYNNFVKENFFVHVPLNAENKIVRLNAYFTFQPLQEEIDKIYGREKIEEPIKEAEENPSIPKDLTDSDSSLEMSPEDILRLNREEDEEFYKRRGLKNHEIEATTEQIRAAKSWYESHPISKHVPFEAMFHMINQSEPDAVATWGMYGITLYKGADYSDLYHEAFHAFTQGFMSKSQKKELYNEVRGKSGSFTDYQGVRVLFSRASDLQIEEYLAEDFRKYMLNGYKTKKNSPKRNSFFRKLLDFLKALFEGTTVAQITANDKANATIKELYDKLRVGDLTGYTFAQENVQFDRLQKGVQAFDTTEPIKELSYQQSRELVETIDSLFAEYIDNSNSNLSEQEQIRFGEFRDILADPHATQSIKRDAKAELESLKDKKTYKYTSAILKSPKQLQRAYMYTKARLSQIYNKKRAQLAEETNAATKARLQKEVDTLSWTIRNFGNLKDLNKNVFDDVTEIKGMIGYHFYKSEKYFDDNKIIFQDKENMTEDETFLKGREGYNRSGNEHSMRELASKEILYLIRSLHKVDANANKIYNKYDVPELADFTEVWNRLARTLENTRSIKRMEQKLLKEAQIYPQFNQLIERLGPVRTGSKTETTLWTNFWKTFNKSRIRLVQMSIEKTENKNGQINYTSKIGEAFNANSRIGRMWESEFKTADPETSKYIKSDKFGNYLDIIAVLEDFKTQSEAPSHKRLAGREYEFFNAIGFKLTDVPEIREALKIGIGGAIWYRRRLAYLVSRGDVIVRNFSDLNQAYESTLNPRTGKVVEGSPDLNNRFKQLQELEGRYSDSVSTYMVTNAEGNAQSEHTLNNTLTVMINSINDADNYNELIQLPHMSNLDVNRNPFAKASTWLNSLFILDVDPGYPEYGQRRMVDGEPVKLILKNLSGVYLNEEDNNWIDGVTSASADEYTKMIMDFHLATQMGIFELMRHADKGTYYSVSVSKILKTGESDAGTDRHYINNTEFFTDTYKNSAYNLILPHIVAELERIGIMRKMAKDGVENFDFHYLEQGQNFVQFDKVLDQKTQERLFELLEQDINDYKTFINSTEGSVIKDLIQQDLNNYFNNQVDRVREKFAEADFIADNLVKDTQKQLKKQNQKSEVNKAAVKEGLLKSFVYNTWIHNVESMSFLYGDLALYNHTKEEFHKRNAGIGSTGELYRTDDVMQDYANTVLGRKYAASRGIVEKAYDGTFDTAVVADNNIGSVYFKDYVDALVKQGVEREKAEKIYKPYSEGSMNEGDAQGWITFDAYRILKNAEGNWSPKQEALYQKIISGVDVNPVEIIEFFPTIKAQYFGPLKTEGLPITAFHKFSLFPLIPSVIKGTNLEKLHNKMMHEGIDYATFESGSKVGTITKDGKADKLYEKNRIVSDHPFTKNTIYVDYLKNQLEIAPKFKGQVIFSTQLRKLVEDGLYEQGEALTPEFKALAEEYEKDIKRLTRIKEDKLLKEAGWKRNINDAGEEVFEGELENLMRFVRKELSRQDLADHEIDFIGVNNQGELIADLSLSLSSEKIEKLLNAIVTKRLVKQKVNGEGLIQVSGAMFESEASRLNRNYENPTEEDNLKWGSNDLPTYHVGADGKTKPMKVKIAMQEDYLKLLQMQHPDGGKIGTIERMNELIKDEEWLNEGNNRAMISMIGVRIPVQGLNSMEFMEIYEFLPAEAGNIIIPPAEIVAKSGSDFDIDKLTVIMPNIKSSVKKAKLTNKFLRTMQEKHEHLDFSRENINIILDAVRDDSDVYTLTDEDKAIIQILNEQAEIEVIYAEGDTEKGIENKLIQNIKNILELPENFTTLTRPNETDIAKPIAEKLAKYVQDYNPAAKENGGDGKHISPTSVFEIEYNLYKHTSNAIGKQTLGLGAVDNSYNVIYNRVGARMNPTAGLSTAEYNRLLAKAASGRNLTAEESRAKAKYHRQKLFLDHNKVKVGEEYAISLSNIMDSNPIKEEQHKISNIINQLINGWVDIAKDTWIFNIQGNKEITPSLLFMIQAGVPIKQAIYFASMPMVREYVKQQRLAKSTFAKPLNKAPENPMYFRSKAREVMLSNPRFGFKLTKSQVQGSRQNNTINNEAIKRIDAYLGKEGKFKEDKMFKTIENFAIQKKDYKFTDLDRAAFLHFLEIENMSKAVRDVKLKTNVDTTKSGTLFEAQEKILMIEELKKDARIPKDLIDNILNNSPIGSFYIQPFQLKIWKNLFKLRSNSLINDFLRERINENRNDITKTFGSAEKFANEFKNDLVNFLFQNELKKFDIDSHQYKSRLINSTTSVEEVISLKLGAFVKDGVLYVDKTRLRDDYVNKRYKDADYEEKRGLARISTMAFSTPEEYFNFVYEREHLRSLISMDEAKKSTHFKKKKSDVVVNLKRKQGENNEDYHNRIEKMTYEAFLRDKALDNIFNHWKLFKSSASYAEQFNIIKNAYPELAEDYALVKQLSIGTGPANFTNLKLNDSFLDSDTINLFNENLKELMNHSITEVRDFFRMFPTVAFLQSGMNTRSVFSLTRIVPQDSFVRIMEGVVKEFDQHLNQAKKAETAPPILNEFYKQFVLANSIENRATRIRGKNYVSEITIERSSKMIKEGKSMSAVTDSLITTNPLTTLETDLKLYDSKTINISNAQKYTEKYPHITFVYNYAIENQNNAMIDDRAFHETGALNVLGLPTRLKYAGKGQEITDADDSKIKPEIKKAIDTAIEALKEQQNSGQQLAFSKQGYGQYMLEKKNITGHKQFVAPQTFLYLSQRLFEEFGYINPGYLATQTGRVVVQSTQPITDEQVKDFMNHCM